MTDLAKKNMSITIDLALKGLESMCDRQGIDLDHSETYRSICARLTDLEWTDGPTEIDDWWELIDRLANLKVSLFNR